MAPLQESLRASPEFALAQKLQIFFFAKGAFYNLLIQLLLKDILGNFCASPCRGANSPYPLTLCERHGKNTF